MTPLSKSWHEHPVYVAAVAVAGTIGLSVLLYKEVLLPAQMAARDFKIEELRRGIDLLTNQKFDLEQQLRQAGTLNSATTKKFEEKLNQVNSELIKTTTTLNEYKIGNLFFNGSPYPIEFGKVKVGQSIHLVSQKYPDAQLEKMDGYWSAKVEHPYFSNVAFYFFEKDDNPIYQIRYSARYSTDVGPDFLQNHIELILGDPLAVSERHFIWSAQQNLAIYKDEDHAFVLGKQGQPPGGWERPLIRFLEKQNTRTSEINQKPQQ
ncbi:hypothetical protein [Alcaligenes sp. Lyrl_28]|uniref:hypothetical protein n=1 Tax=Alcaligenes sp. Lyrl_28 TaxID=3110924 RepID=UPI003F7B5E9F